MSSDSGGDMGHAETTISFPDGFLWGAATAAHQIEGGNVNNDWWDWEHAPATPCAYSSGDACDSWERPDEDAALVAGLGLGAYRFSLEWSRIEPAEGEFSRAALDHYRRMAVACRDHGVVPVVTFHHYTVPRWFAALGGFESDQAPALFARFVERATAHLGDVVGMACTLNEPNVLALMGYLLGRFPPGVEDFERHHRAVQSVIACHHGAVDALRAGPGDFPVGLTLSMAELQAVEGGEEVRAAAQEILEDTFLREVGGDDFVGVQGYTRIRFGPEGPLDETDATRTTQMGYEFWPGVVEHTVRRTAAMTGLPVYVTESGIGTDDDSERVAYMHEALVGLHRCIADGVDLRGYFAWSLLDNFEWNDGYRPTFGLHAVDRTTFERRPKPSAAWFGGVASTNRLSPPK
ncbi:MAG: family 1 glycosylhydrolase [Acidimicrobiales bacterium]